MNKSIFAFIILSVFLVACANTPIIKEQATTSDKIKTCQVTKYKEEKIPYGTPRCEQMPYNFTKVTYVYSVDVVNNKRFGVCTFLIKNEEDIKGTFEFFPNIFKDGKISDGPQISKDIEPFRTEEFEWKFMLDDNAQVGSCMIQCDDCPHRVKCFYLEPITYSIKRIPYTENVSC
jgi:hypothetical protein